MKIDGPDAGKSSVGRSRGPTWGKDRTARVGRGSTADLNSVQSTPNVAGYEGNRACSGQHERRIVFGGDLRAPVDRLRVAVTRRCGDIVKERRRSRRSAAAAKHSRKQAGHDTSRIEDNDAGREQERAERECVWRR
jgi:hypothetical protein